MKKFCQDLKEHAMKIFKYENKEITLLTNKVCESYDKKTTTFAKKNLKTLMIKFIIELEISVIIHVNLKLIIYFQNKCKESECHLKNETIKRKALQFSCRDCNKDYEKEFHEE